MSAESPAKFFQQCIELAWAHRYEWDNPQNGQNLPIDSVPRNLNTLPLSGHSSVVRTKILRAPIALPSRTLNPFCTSLQQGHDPFRLDLLKAYPPLRAFLRSDIWPKEINFRFTAYAFAVGVGLLLFGPQDREHNVVLTVFWAYWWPVIFLVYPFLGRVWCAGRYTFPFWSGYAFPLLSGCTFLFCQGILFRFCQGMSFLLYSTSSWLCSGVPSCFWSAHSQAASVRGSFLFFSLSSLVICLFCIFYKYYDATRCGSGPNGGPHLPSLVLPAARQLRWYGPLIVFSCFLPIGRLVSLFNCFYVILIHFWPPRWKAQHRPDGIWPTGGPSFYESFIPEARPVSH
jgi:hypothetical protein